MNIWLISSSYPRTPSESINAGVLARDLALDLADRGDKVTIVTPAKPGGISVDPGLRLYMIRWWKPSEQLSNISTRSLLDIVRVMTLLVSARLTLNRLLRTDPPDGIIALWALPSGIFARWVAKRRQVPYAVWLLGSDVWRAREIFCGVTTLRRVLQDSEACFADGVLLAEEAKKLTRVEVEFLPSARRIPRVNPPVTKSIDVAFVGRFHPNKGPDILIKSLAILARKGHFVRAVLHGSGELERSLRELAGQENLEDRISIKGPVDPSQLSSLLCSTRLLVIPSRIESIPLILGDAIQTRTPVLATAVGDLGRLVKQLGIGGVVEPENPSAMAVAIEECLSQPAESFDWVAADTHFAPEVRTSRIRSVFAQASRQSRP